MTATRREVVEGYWIDDRYYEMPSPKCVAELEKKHEWIVRGIKDPSTRSVLVVMFERALQEASA